MVLHTLSPRVFPVQRYLLVLLDRDARHTGKTDHQLEKDLRNDTLILHAYRAFEFECRERLCEQASQMKLDSVEQPFPCHTELRNARRLCYEVPSWYSSCIFLQAYVQISRIFQIWYHAANHSIAKICLVFSDLGPLSLARTLLATSFSDRPLFSRYSRRSS